MQRFFTAYDFLNHPEWPQLPQNPSGNESDGLWAEQTHSCSQKPLNVASVQQLDANATTVQSSTMQEWVDGPYNPGDRRSPPATSMHQRRNAPRQDGFPCDIPDCLKVYSRHCDLKWVLMPPLLRRPSLIPDRRHKKTHLVRSERPHKCSICDEGFIYPKDRNRHQRTHAPQEVLFCPVQGCNNRDGFSRRDNLQRHMRNQHPHVVIAAWETSSWCILSPLKNIYGLLLLLHWHGVSGLVIILEIPLASRDSWDMPIIIIFGTRWGLGHWDIGTFL